MAASVTNGRALCYAGGSARGLLHHHRGHCLDIQRMIGTAATGKKICMSRIYDRIAWLEEVFLASEREMLRRWKTKIEGSGDTVEHLLSHDEMVLTVNWETATDRRNTQLNCAITADARSGYVYRLDVDFDP